MNIRHSSNLFLVLALGLSSFAFLWNPLGFPPLRYEDGTYIGRGMHALVAHTPQDGKFYDHPYFGQLFLAGTFWLIGYPAIVHPSAVGDVLMSVELLWLVPKVFIGILGIIDTFLIYKISERRYNAQVGFIASILFALMSISLLRTVYLESLQLPLILTSIFFALNAKVPRTNNSMKKNYSYVLISGIFMGLAIFTKIPAFIMIPLVVFIILTSRNKKLTALSLWIIPVVLIPSIWPAYAISHVEFDYWLNGIYWQTHRQSAGTALEADRQATLANSITTNFLKMPVLFVLGFSGLAFAAMKKDFFLLLWAIPILGFLYFIGFASEFHLIPILPLLCISSARFIHSLSNMITRRTIRELFPYFIISALAIFGLMNIFIPITTDGNDDKFKAAAFVTRYLYDNKDSDITMIATHVYSWIPKYVFHLGDDYRIPEIDPIETGPKINKSLFVVDRTFKSIMSGNDVIGERLRKVFDTYTKYNTTTVTAGGNNIILPKADTLNIKMTQDNTTNLLGSEYDWKLRGKGQLSHADGTLKILVNTNGKEEISRYAILQTQLDNLMETPFVLSLSYSSKSPEGNDRFSIEIKDTVSQKRYFKTVLMDTSGNETSQLFILPSEIIGKAIEFRFGLTTNTPGEHTLLLNKVTIIYKV